MSRAGSLVVGVLVMVGWFAGPAAAQDPDPDAPVVSLESVTAPEIQSYTDCDGDTSSSTVPGQVILARTVATDEVTVGLSVTGPVVDPPTQVTFAEGSATAAAVLVLDDGGGNDSISVTVLPGDGYELGDPIMDEARPTQLHGECFPEPEPTPSTTEAEPILVAPVFVHRPPAPAPSAAATLPRTGSPTNWWLIGAGGFAVAAGCSLVRAGRRLTVR